MIKTETDYSALYSAFSTELDLCNLKPNELVVLLTDETADRSLVDLGFSILRDRGNPVYELKVPRGTNGRLMQSDPFATNGLIDNICRADLVLCFFVGFFSVWQKPALSAGTRVVNVLDNGQQLVGQQTSMAVKQAVLAARQRIAAAKTMRVTSEAGTDLQFAIDENAPISAHYGFADEPGTMDQWGQAMVATYCADGSGDGRVVVQPGDVWILPYARMVQTPIELEVREGFIRKISGGTDAMMFKKWLDRSRIAADDMDPYALSHLGWGLNPKASWDDIVLYENQPAYLMSSMRSYPGSFLFSTGPSWKRKTRGHIDMPMNHCTIELDGQAVVSEGRIVMSDMVVDPDRAGH